MKSKKLYVLVLLFSLTILVAIGSTLHAKDVVRPEEVKSLRLVVYEKQAYAKLADQWRKYYDAYPSEYAYANWMRAADYAQDPDFRKKLDKGLERYPANPMLLYLKAMEKSGAHDDLEGRAKLERAVALDPDFVDPWFALVTHYMDARDDERLNVALRHILESGAIADEVLDYNYNMISLLEQDAILVTNGDNDTFPGWILTRILKFRPDVTIVNRSLLNTDWYPLYVIEQGLPRFVEKEQLDSLREYTLRKMRKNKSQATAGIFSDTLILRIVEFAARAGRPVYLARTLYLTDDLEKLMSGGVDLGLVALVTDPNSSNRKLLHDTYSRWIDSFRTAGLKSWRLRYSQPSDAGRSLVRHYGIGIEHNLNALNESAPDLTLPLFEWYIEYAEEIMPPELQGKLAQTWCRGSGNEKIDVWCKQQGIKR